MITVRHASSNMKIRLGSGKKKKISTALLLVVVGLLGSYLTFFSSAASNQPQVDIGWGIDNISNIPLGSKISPPVSLLNDSPVDKTAIVISTYYSSKYLSLTGVSCEPAIRCVAVAWPNFDNDVDTSNYMPTSTPNGPVTTSLASFRYDHKFSVCVNKPHPVSASEPLTLLYTPHFKVIGNSKRFVISMLVRYYANGDCNANGGQSGSWYKTQREVNWYLCYNQSSPTGSGNPYDGISRDSCLETGRTLPAGNDKIYITGGLSGPQTGKRGTNKGTSSGRGGGGGSSATTNSQTSNTLPSTSAQGTTKQSAIVPSPFFDGRQYAQGSDSGSQSGGLFSRTADTAPLTGRHITVASLIIIGIVAGGFWWRRRYFQKK